MSLTGREGEAFCWGRPRNTARLRTGSRFSPPFGHICSSLLSCISRRRFHVCARAAIQRSRDLILSVEIMPSANTLSPRAQWICCNIAQPIYFWEFQRDMDNYFPVHYVQDGKNTPFCNWTALFCSVNASTTVGLCRSFWKTPIVRSLQKAADLIWPAAIQTFLNFFKCLVLPSAVILEGNRSWPFWKIYTFLFPPHD
jgi:hypothetical protein